MMTFEEEAIARRGARELGKAIDAEEVWLFGSRAWGGATAWSDYDFLAVVGDAEGGAKLRDLVRLSYRRLASLGVSKDIVLLTRNEMDRDATLNASLAGRVQRDGVKLYERTQG